MKAKFNFKKAKYALPLLCFPFIVGLGYIVFEMMPQKEVVNDGLQTAESFNTEMPLPTEQKGKDKFEAYKDKYEKETDFSSIKEIEIEKDKHENSKSIYTDEEIAEIINNQNKTGNLQHNINEKTGSIFGTGENKNLDRKPKDEQLQEIEELKRQVAQLDSLRNAQYNRLVIDSSKMQQPTQEEKILSVTLAEFANSHFNTINNIKDKKNFIKAILDEVQTVVDGSRIRIRLVDDIKIGDINIKKGTYLFGLVSGFSAQRVYITVSSFLYQDKILKIKLVLYDIDGIEGLYVPKSDFRELIKNIGGSLGQQSVTFENSPNTVQQFAYRALSDAYRATSQAVSQKIKQNKARLKYDTFIYLISEE
jgi:hypothetical protein